MPIDPSVKRARLDLRKISNLTLVNKERCYKRTFPIDGSDSTQF